MTSEDVIAIDNDVLETPTIGHKNNSKKAAPRSISPKTTSGEKIDTVITQALESNMSSKKKLLDLQKHKVELQMQREERKRKAESNKEMEIEAKIMAEDNRAKEIDNRAKEIEHQQKRLEMEQEKHDASMRHQQAQLEALKANQKSSQEVNMKVLEFMSLMASKLADK